MVSGIEKLFHVVKSGEESIILQLYWQSALDLGTFVDVY